MLNNRKGLNVTLFLLLSIFICPGAFSSTVSPLPAAIKKPATVAAQTKPIELTYFLKIRQLIYAKDDRGAIKVLNEFFDNVKEGGFKKNVERRLASLFDKNGFVVESYQLYLKIYGFPLFMLAGLLLVLLIAGFYMGVFSLIKAFFRQKTFVDPPPTIFRPRHIFYFLFWIIFVPFTFDITLAWAMNTFRFFIGTADVNQSTILFFDLVLVVVSLIYLRKKYRLDTQTIGFISRGFKINVLLPIAVVAGEMFAIITLFLLFNHFHLKVHKTPLHHMVDTTLHSAPASNIFIMVMLLVIIGPVTEEIVFRGFFYNAFKKHTNVFWAVVLSAGLFASAHDPQPFVFLVIFMSGVVLGVIYEKTRSLVPCMVCHMFHNSVCLLAMVATHHI